MIKKTKFEIAILVVTLVIASLSTICLVKTAAQKAYVSITFDDGWLTQYNYALPILQAYNMKATFYIPTAYVGIWWGFLNPPQQVYMDVAQLQALQAAGMEIGSHGTLHPDYTTLDEATIRQQLSDSKTALQSWGLTANNFAYPEGKSNAFTDRLVLEYYRSARNGFVAPYVMAFPTSTRTLPCFADIGDGVNILPTLKALVDDVAASGGWEIINFHNVDPSGTFMPNTPPAVFSAFLDYLQQKGVMVKTVNEMLDLADTQPTPTPTPSPTPLPSASPTPQPTVTPTVTPTPTTTPTLTPTPMPTMTQADWADYGKWIANGSALQTWKTIAGK